MSAAGTEEYVYDKDGHQVGEMQPNGTLNRVEFYAENRHLATYDGNPYQTIFIHSDWQGTERLRTLYDGVTIYQTCTNLPYGDSLSCSNGNGTDGSPLHYTGQVRDPETGLDYYGARYYSSGMGRWMSADWSASPSALPYANGANPQTFNLSALDAGSPATYQDLNGHLISLSQLWAYGGAAAMTADQVGVWDFGMMYDIVGPSFDPFSGSQLLGNNDKYDISASAVYIDQDGAFWYPDPNGDPGDLKGGWNGEDESSLSDSEKAFTAFGSPLTQSTSLPPPTKYKAVLPGTHYCGPGGNGTTTSRVDQACAAHDKCYNDAGATALNNMVGTGGAAMQAKIQACNAQLCSTLTKISASWPSSQESGQIFLVGEAFGCAI